MTDIEQIQDDPDFSSSQEDTDISPSIEAQIELLSGEGKPLVAIVGRPNVGKSTLFNRLAGRRIAIVQDTPGITRDRLYTEGDWQGRNYILVDTGGIQMYETDPLKAQVRAQAEIAMEEADVIVLVIDTVTGITSEDVDLANALRRSEKPMIVLANKVDNGDQENRNVPEVYALGFPDVFPVSALSGRGVADALDAIVERFPPILPGELNPPKDDRIKIAIVGRPNVGKSSLLNSILGEERAIVSPIAGTTRDAVDTPFMYNDHEIVLIDTAGIRRAGKIQGSVEFYTVLRAKRAIARADVVMLVVDSLDGITDGDKRVGGYAHEAGRAAVIVVNKWDEGAAKVKAELEGINPMNTFRDELRDGLPFMAYAPIAFVSALTGKGVPAAVDTALDAAENHSMRIATGELNRLLRDASEAHPHTEKGKLLKIYYATMPSVKPPRIIVFVNNPELVHFSYKRYLENEIRKTFAFEGTPIILNFKKATDKERVR